MLSLHVRRQDKPGQSEMRAFERPVVTIGRHPDNDLVLPESTISRQHARIEQRDGQWRLIDLGSSHGCYLNKERVQDVALADGAEIYLNPFVLTVQIPTPEPRPGAPGVDTTASPFDAPKGTVLELQMGPAAAAAAPDQPTPAEGTVFELTARPPGPRGGERKTDPIPRGGGRIQPEADEPTIPPPKSPPKAPEPPVEEGTVFELSAGPVRKASGKEPTPGTPLPAAKAPLPRTPTPPAMPKAPTPAPVPAPRAPTPAPRPAVPPTRMRKKDDGPKAGPEPEAPAPDPDAPSPEERLPVLIEAHFHGKVLGVFAAVVALFLALIPVQPAEGPQTFLWRTDAGNPGPLFFWLVLGGALTAVGAGIFASNGTLRGPLYAVAGALPLVFLVIRPPSRETLARLLPTQGNAPGWRALAVDEVYHLQDKAPLWLALALVGVTTIVVAFRLSRLHPESPLTRILGGLGGACCLALLLAPASPELGGETLAAALPGALRHSPANFILCVPPFAGLLAVTLTTGLGLGPLARIASGAVFAALLLPGMVHALANSSLATLHQGRLVLLPVLLFFLASTGIAALLLDVLLGQDPEEQAMLDAL